MVNDKPKKVAVITGAAGGIGKALAIEAAAQDYQLALADLDRNALNHLQQRFGNNAMATQIDVSDAESMQSFANEVFDQYGHVDLLFNNAGIFNTGTIIDQSPNDWQKIMQVNFFGILNGIQAFAPRMVDRNRKSYIVNTASVSGLYAFPMVGSYAVSKSAVIALSEVLNIEMVQGKGNVQVSVICPGAVKTGILNPDRYNTGLERSEEADKYLARIQEALPENGMETMTLAKFVFQKLLDGKFWIMPHPDMLEPVLTRAQNIVSGTNPIISMTRRRKR